MKKLAFLLLCLLPFCASARLYKLHVNHSISEIVNSSEADVELIYSPEKSGQITYSSSEAEAPLKITVSPLGILTISTARKHNYKVSTVKIYSGAFIKNIVNKGTGDFQTAEINAPVDLKISNSGTGDVEIDNINVKTLSINNPGTGDVKIDGGKTVVLNIRNSGTGDVKAKILSAECEIRNPGTGDVTAVRESSKRMSLSNCGTGKIVIKRHKDNTPKVNTDHNCNRNIRFIK